MLVLLVVLLGAGALGVALSGGDDRAPTAGQAASVPRTGTAPGTAAGTEPHASGDRGGGTAATGADTRVPPGTAAALFAVTCAPCHSLAAVRRLGAPHGTIGPDLDELRPSRERVLAAIRNGGLGGGLMPSGLLGPRGAKRVAAYVARVAGGRADASPP